METNALRSDDYNCNIPQYTIYWNTLTTKTKNSVFTLENYRDKKCAWLKLHEWRELTKSMKLKVCKYRVYQWKVWKVKKMKMKCIMKTKMYTAKTI